MARVLERVRGVGISHEQCVRPALANGAQVGQVAAGADLHLDASIPLVEKPRHLLDEALDGWFYTQADTGVDLAAGSPECRRERLAVRAGEQIPARHLQTGLGEVVAADGSPRFGGIVGVLPVDA